MSKTLLGTRPVSVTCGSILALALSTSSAWANDAELPRQAMEDAWWTGPLLANSAATLPRGHYLVETYLYDVRTQDYIDRDGARRKVPTSHGYGSQTYFIYGVTDKISAGMIPTFGYNDPEDTPNSSRIATGDLALQAQYRLTQFHPDNWVPTTALVVRETIPTGKYDRLGNRASDGMGKGAYTTTIALNTQWYFWAPNGRLLRMRLNLSKSLSTGVDIDGASVYGTPSGFRGHAAAMQSTPPWNTALRAIGSLR